MVINNKELEINKIFSSTDVKHGISLFKKEEIDYINSLIVEKEGKLSIKCQIRNKYVPAKPEEIVRQLWIYELLTIYGYPKERIEIEREIQFGTNKGYADITVLQEDKQTPYIIFEIKRPERTDGLKQLRSYCNAEGVPIGVWSNGNEIVRLYREEPNIFKKIKRIPKVTETPKDVLSERRTIKELEEDDELKEGKTTLTKILLDLKELVLGNSGADLFEEIFKLIYAKLYDEWKGINDPNYQLDFFVGERSDRDVKKAVSGLLEGAKKQWSGVFEPTDKIKLRDEHLAICVSYLENIKLFNSNLRIIDDAFEYLLSQSSKQEQGQFFTPRIVEDMCIKMLNPKPSELVIDPACGSAGFLLHSIMWVSGGGVISGKPLSLMAQNFAQNNIYGIDFDEKVVKIAKAINLIAGDGKSHILKDNSLAPQTWNEETRTLLKDKLSRFINEPEKEQENQENFLYFDFDVLMTNPPFAGTVAERDILRLYRLAEKNGRIVNKIGRHILFLERSLQFIRPGGRMAIVLPQGLLNNTSAEYIRRFIIDEARILAVVDLHENTFKPHTGTKTSVLFLRKYTDEEKENIQQIRLKYGGEWEKFLESLKEKYKNLAWDSSLDEGEIPEELDSFISTYFEVIEESDKLSTEEEEGEKENKRSFAVLVQEESKLEESLNKKKEELENANAITKTKLKKEIKALERKRNKVVKEISQRTLAGQISLVLSDEKITDAFKKYWLDGKVMKEMDYSIFFAVNEKPVKDESGEYRYKKNPNGYLVLNEYGYPVIDHDLDEIAEEFINFAKEQLAKGDNHFDFWR